MPRNRPELTIDVDHRRVAIRVVGGYESLSRSSSTAIRHTLSRSARIARRLRALLPDFEIRS